MNFELATNFGSGTFSVPFKFAVESLAWFDWLTDNIIKHSRKSRRGLRIYDVTTMKDLCGGLLRYQAVWATIKYAVSTGRLENRQEAVEEEVAQRSDESDGGGASDTNDKVIASFSSACLKNTHLPLCVKSRIFFVAFAVNVYFFVPKPLVIVCEVSVPCSSCNEPSVDAQVPSRLGEWVSI